MPKHYLAFNHDPHDGATVFGVFDTFVAARDYLDSDAALEQSSTARYADIEEWDGPEHVRTIERNHGDKCDGCEICAETLMGIDPMAKYLSTAVSGFPHADVYTMAENYSRARPEPGTI